MVCSLHWRHSDHDGVSNHQPRKCLLNRVFRRRSRKTPKLRVIGLCVGEFPAQMASNAENVSIWWRLHVIWRQEPIAWSKVDSTHCGLVAPSGDTGLSQHWLSVMDWCLTAPSHYMNVDLSSARFIDNPRWPFSQEIHQQIVTKTSLKNAYLQIH